MKNDRLKQHIVDTDYYTLALSWSPAFCQNKSEIITVKFRLIWNINVVAQRILVGLFTAYGRKVARQEVLMNTLVIAKAICRWWQSRRLSNIYLNRRGNFVARRMGKHGACAFNQADDYFAKQKSYLISSNYRIPKCLN